MNIPVASLRPIAADDAAIEAHLQTAHIPSLLAALVHITGDPEIVRSVPRPEGELFGDPQGGLTEAQQAAARATATRVLGQLRDGEIAPQELNDDVIRELMSFVAGVDLPDDYMDFLKAELSMHGEDPFEAPAMNAAQAQRDQFRVLIIGAGMSGLLAAIRLKSAGIPWTIIEKNTDVGGTWLENQYPGCRVDSPNHTYSYSFEQRDWPNYYSPQPVLRAYFDQVATDHSLRENIQFSSEVTEARFDSDAQLWRLRVKRVDGSQEELTGNALIAATGQLNQPRWPEIKGMERFQGPAFHTARWETEHNLEGKRVTVIGTGASAFQLVPEVAREAAEINIFQRTPPWIAPREEYHDAIPEGKHWLLNHVPFYSRWFRFQQFWVTAEGLLSSVRADPSWNDTASVSADNEALRTMLTEAIREQIGDDPELFAKAIPDYPPAGKRMLLDNGSWFQALKRDNVHLHTDPITEITETGVRTKDGNVVETDVLIYATGFRASDFLFPMSVINGEGQELHDHWQGNPRAYMGITIPGFPNLFCLYGPNTNIVVNGSIIFFSECEVRYILGCLRLLIDNGHRTMDCRRDVHDAYNEKIDAGNALMAWGSPHVNSWYKNSEGRVTQNWPGTLIDFWNQTRAPDPADYAFG